MSEQSSVPDEWSDGTFRKLPVEIQALRWDPSREPSDYPNWLWESIPSRQCIIDPETSEVIIQTGHGEVRAAPGDWIIQGVQGEIYPCTHEVFVQTYEPAE